ncbi:MAG: hypothetical protein H8E11_04555 [Candidatus Cloacimonetes bacterium]|nr:hypothetical protein [Candidatus Cloacimonadota bacterium]
MKNIKLTILFLFIISFSFADTTIPGGNVNGVWTLAGSPYYIDGEITIPMSDMLTIQPGVEIKFNGHYKFIVFGRILAEGTEQDSILFTIADTTGFSNIWTTDGGWHSLRFFSTIYNGQGNSILNRCRIEYAKTPHDTGTYAERRGGGIYINLSSNLEITNCEISNNVADYGAGIYCWESSPVMSGLTVKNNYAWHDAGGIMFSGANTNPTLENSIISGNSCHYDGGGIFCCSSSTPVISNVTITGNSCIDWEGAEGGGISCWGANPVLNNVNLSDNFSIGNGGGISCSHNSSIIINDGIINRNIADWSGGGIWISNSSINLCGVTISENVTAGNGGGIYFGNNAVTVFDPDNRCNIYCNIDINDNIGNDLHANNLTNVDVIVDTFTVMTPNDYYVYPMENFTFDIQTGMIEPVNADLYVSPEGSNTNSGLTPDDPLKNINFAIQMVIADESNPVSIFLANGVYSPSQTQELFPIFTKDFVDIVGEDRENTILDAEETNRVIYAHEVTQSVKNLTTKNGSPYSYENGGGIFINDSDIELENLLITSNSSNYYGGGIYCNYSEPIFNNIRIENNSANGYYGTGGGIYFKDSNPILSSVTISHNYASNGGGIFFDNSNPVFDAENRCNIYNNSSEINYGNDLFARYDEIVNVIVDTFTVYEPTVTQINYPNNITIDIQNSIILPIDSDIFVSPSGSNENSGLTPDDPFQTISFALNSISSNAINPRNIYLDDGIYSFSTTGEQFPLAGKDHVQIIGEDRETTIVDGESIRGLFLLDHVQNFTLEKIQLLNGHTQRNYNYQYEHGGAINTVYSAFCLNNVIFLNNSAQYGGGGFSYGSDIKINNTNFSDNSAYGGGGVYSSFLNIIL